MSLDSEHLPPKPLPRLKRKSALKAAVVKCEPPERPPPPSSFLQHAPVPTKPTPPQFLISGEVSINKYSNILSSNEGNVQNDYLLPDVTKVSNSLTPSSCAPSRQGSFNAKQWSKIINGPDNDLEPTEWAMLRSKEAEEVLEVCHDNAFEAYSIRSTPSPLPASPRQYFLSPDPQQSTNSSLTIFHSVGGTPERQKCELLSLTNIALKEGPNVIESRKLSVFEEKSCALKWELDQVLEKCTMVGFMDGSSSQDRKLWEDVKRDFMEEEAAANIDWSVNIADLTPPDVSNVEVKLKNEINAEEDHCVIESIQENNLSDIIELGSKISGAEEGEMKENLKLAAERDINPLYPSHQIATPPENYSLIAIDQIVLAESVGSVARASLSATEENKKANWSEDLTAVSMYKPTCILLHSSEKEEAGSTRILVLNDKTHWEKNEESCASAATNTKKTISATLDGNESVASSSETSAPCEPNDIVNFVHNKSSVPIKAINTSEVFQPRVDNTSAKKSGYGDFLEELAIVLENKSKKNCMKTSEINPLHNNNNITYVHTEKSPFRLKTTAVPVGDKVNDSRRGNSHDDANVQEKVNSSQDNMYFLKHTTEVPTTMNEIDQSNSSKIKDVCYDEKNCNEFIEKISYSASARPSTLMGPKPYHVFLESYSLRQEQQKKETREKYGTDLALNLRLRNDNLRTSVAKQGNNEQSSLFVDVTQHLVNNEQLSPLTDKPSNVNQYNISCTGTNYNISDKLRNIPHSLQKCHKKSIYLEDIRSSSDNTEVFASESVYLISEGVEGIAAGEDFQDIDGAKDVLTEDICLNNAAAVFTVKHISQISDGIIDEFTEVCPVSDASVADTEDIDISDDPSNVFLEDTSQINDSPGLAVNDISEIGYASKGQGIVEEELVEKSQFSDLPKTIVVEPATELNLHAMDGITDSNELNLSLNYGKTNAVEDRFQTYSIDDQVLILSLEKLKESERNGRTITSLHSLYESRPTEEPSKFCQESLLGKKVTHEVLSDFPISEAESTLQYGQNSICPIELMTSKLINIVPKVTVTPCLKSQWHSQVLKLASPEPGEEWMDTSDLWLKKMYQKELNEMPEQEEGWSDPKTKKKVRFLDSVERIPICGYDSDVEDSGDNENEPGRRAGSPEIVIYQKKIDCIEYDVAEPVNKVSEPAQGKEPTLPSTDGGQCKWKASFLLQI